MRDWGLEPIHLNIGNSRRLYEDNRHSTSSNQSRYLSRVRVMDTNNWNRAMEDRKRHGLDRKWWSIGQWDGIIGGVQGTLKTGKK